MLPDRKYVYAIEYKEDIEMTNHWKIKEETFINQHTYEERLEELKIKTNVADIKAYCGEIFRI